mgnify:CR=1 FL=1
MSSQKQRLSLGSQATLGALFVPWAVLFALLVALVLPATPVFTTVVAASTLDSVALSSDFQFQAESSRLGEPTMETQHSALSYVLVNMPDGFAVNVYCVHDDPLHLDHDALEITNLATGEIGVLVFLNGPHAERTVMLGSYNAVLDEVLL